MINTSRLLVVVDGSPAGQRAVAYVGAFFGRRKGFRICLAHLLPPLPAELLEFGGVENPTEETREQAQLRAEQKRYRRAEKQKDRGVLEAATDVVHKAGVPRSAIETRFWALPASRDPADEVLEMAQARRCKTVVVGRCTTSWIRELLGGDLAEKLVRRGERITVWVVE